MRYLFISSRMAIKKKKAKKMEISVDEDVKWEPSYVAGRNVK